MKEYNEGLFMKTNISAITFDGIDDDLLHVNDQGTIEIDIPFDRFGWFYDVSILIQDCLSEAYPDVRHQGHMPLIIFEIVYFCP